MAHAIFDGNKLCWSGSVKLLGAGRWSLRFKRFAGRFSDAWDAVGRFLVVTALVSIIGAAVLELGIVTSPVDTPSKAYPGVQVVFWDLTILALIFSVPFFGLALLGFYMYLVDPPYRPFGLDTVHSQGVHNTGALAREAAIDAALRDEDEEGTPLLEFDE